MAIMKAAQIVWQKFIYIIVLNDNDVIKAVIGNIKILLYTYVMFDISKKKSRHLKSRYWQYCLKEKY